MFDLQSDESEGEEPKRNQRAKAPKPMDFPVAQLQAGQKAWHAGGDGGMVTFADLGCSAREVPKKEVLLLGKVLFGRQRFAFEVQVLDHTPAAVKKILKKAREIEEDRFGPSDFSDFGFGKPASPESRSLSWLDVWKAGELTAKHSIQVKFQDIERIEVLGDEVSLILSKAPHCYVKPEGEMNIVNMEVAKDITGGARCIKFKTTDAQPQSCQRPRQNVQIESFSTVRRMVSTHSPRMDALFRGQEPPKPVATPARKRKTVDEDGSSKKPRVDPSKLLEEISAPDGSWLKQAVDRFQLKGIRNHGMSEAEWKQYFQERESLECYHDEEEEAEEEELEEDEEVDGERRASRILHSIRSSVAATMKSSSLGLDAEAFVQGVFLISHDINDADEGEPRRVEAHARVYAPNASGNYVELWYTNHHRVRMSFTERFSHLFASRGGPNMKPVAHPEMGKKKCEKIFDLDYNEYRRKNQVKTSLATNATLTSLGAHLFGAEGAVSNRKVFGLLVRAVGLGQFGESNGWPIAMARRRFKCGKGDTETDTESICGDTCEEADVGNCCIM